MSAVPEFGERVPGESYRPRPGSYAVLFDDAGRVAVVTTPRGASLPGGGADPGETAEDTLRREVREECGFDVIAERCVCRAIQYVYAEGEGFFAKDCTFFLARRRDGAPAGAGESDHHLEWLDPAEALIRLPQASQAWAVSQCLRRA